MGLEPFRKWLDAWDLIPDGEPFASNWSQLLPVRRGDTPLMLKAAMSEQEVVGSAVLDWFSGQGAARVVERHDDAVLMERLFGPTALTDLPGRTVTAEHSKSSARLHISFIRPPNGFPSTA